MIEVLSDANVEYERAQARARLGNPQLSLTLNYGMAPQMTGQVGAMMVDPIQPLQTNVNTMNNVQQMEPMVGHNMNTMQQIDPLAMNSNSLNSNIQPVHQVTNITNHQQTNVWDYISNDSSQQQLNDVLKEEDFIRVVQINENLKRLHVVGEVLAETGFLQRSDARMKENIEPLKDCLNTILRLTGKSFKYKGKDEKKLGFIAQEVREVCPELVHEDENGLSVDVIGVIPILVEALKDINKVANDTQDETTTKFRELSDVSNKALETVRIIANHLDDEEERHKHLGVVALEKTSSFNFSLGPSIVTLVLGIIFTIVSGVVVVSYPKLPGVWVFIWTFTIFIWSSFWRTRRELKESFQKNKLILYWHKENSISLYIFLFLGLLTIGMSVIIGSSVIALSIVCICVFFVLSGACFLFNKKYKVSFTIIFTSLMLFFFFACIIISILFIIQPDYKCYFVDHKDSSNYVLKVKHNQPISKQIINELPWNCWYSEFSFSEKLPDGFNAVTDFDNSSPFIEGKPNSFFNTTTISVYIKCIDLVKFYCSSITFKICEGRHTSNDCIQNGCNWDAVREKCD